MPYKYVALTTSGQLTNGQVDADDEASAEDVLGQAGYRVLTLKASGSTPAIDKLFPTLFGVKPAQMISFSKQLASLLEAGIDIVKAMDVLVEQAPSGAMCRLLGEMREKLQGGSPLGVILSRYPAIFGATYRRMVEVGEQTGCLEASLRQAAGYMEKQGEAAKKIGRALVYPAIVASVAVVVVVLLVVLVLPAMAGLFSNLGAQLPLPTRMLMAGSAFLRANILVIALGLGCVGGMGYFWSRRPEGRRALHRLLLKLPLLGRIALYGEVSRFAGTMATLLKAGVTVADSARLAIGSCKNEIVREALQMAAEQLVQGRGLSGPMAQANLFPPMMIQMVRVGEETGSLDATLAVAANTYETEAMERSQALITMLEPAVTVVIAGVVGFIALSVIMPIYSVLGSIK